MFVYNNTVNRIKQFAQKQIVFNKLVHVHASHLYIFKLDLSLKQPSRVYINILLSC